MDVQRMLDLMSAEAQLKRAQTQMTLGELIFTLDKVREQNPKVVGLSDSAHSYRGYYSDLAFGPGETTAVKLLTACRLYLNSALTGWKGGEFRMTKATPVWMSFGGAYASSRILEILLLHYDRNTATISAYKEGRTCGSIKPRPCGCYAP